MALYIDDNDNSLDFWRAYCLFVALVASFAPSLRSGANDATRATNKQYALQKFSYCPVKVPVRSNFVDFSKVYVTVTYQTKPFFNPSTRSLEVFFSWYFS